MKKLFKIKFIFFILIFFCLISVLPVYAEALKAPKEEDDLLTKAVKPYLQVAIGDFSHFGDSDWSEVDCNGKTCIEVPWIGQYISALYQYGVGVAMILATVMIMAGGLFWLMSAGSPDKIGKGKEFITSALSGMMIALFSFLILTTVNPRLVNLDPLRVQKIDQQGIDITKRTAAFITSQSEEDIKNLEALTGLEIDETLLGGSIDGVPTEYAFWRAAIEHYFGSDAAMINDLLGGSPTVMNIDGNWDTSITDPNTQAAILDFLDSENSRGVVLSIDTIPNKPMFMYWPRDQEDPLYIMPRDGELLISQGTTGDYTPEEVSQIHSQSSDASSAFWIGRRWVLDWFY